VRAYYEEGERFRTNCARKCLPASRTSNPYRGKGFGDPADPLLVSVRSGARVSMPGMMDTVLNLGLNDDTVQGLAAISGDDRFAWDSYRRFIQMYSDVVLGLDHGAFEEALEIAKEDRGVHLDTDLEAATAALVARYKAWSRSNGQALPQDVQQQLWGAVGAGVRLVAVGRGQGLSPPERHPRRLGHGRQRAGDGLRQYGRHSATGVALPRDPSTASALITANI
jgi:pyruvate,orthophosphate dikinase